MGGMRSTGAGSTRLYAQNVHEGAFGPGRVVKLADAAENLSVQFHGDLLVLDHAHLHGCHLHVPECEGWCRHEVKGDPARFKVELRLVIRSDRV